MVYRLGVDIGTTFTAAAVANGSGPAMLGLGNRALQVPSVLFLTEEDQFLVGEAAERRGLAQPDRVIREFKRRIGDHVPLLVAGRPYSPEILTAQLLGWVVHLASTQLGEPPLETIVTYPANWGPYKLELLDQAVAMADIGFSRRCPEPVAAAARYAARSRVEVGERLAVYDLGGGTFDVCVLEQTGHGFRVLGHPDGIEHLGGVDFDEALFHWALTALGGAVSELNLDDQAVVIGMARLRRDIVDAKEALSSDTSATVVASLPGLNRTVRLTRREFETIIRPSLGTTVDALARSIRSAGIAADDLHAIVLIGGSSRIPLVGELLQRALNVPVAMDTHPKHDVALGATLVEPESAPSGAVRAVIEPSRQPVEPHHLDFGPSTPEASALPADKAPVQRQGTEPERARTPVTAESIPIQTPQHQAPPQVSPVGRKDISRTQTRPPSSEPPEPIPVPPRGRTTAPRVRQRGRPSRRRLLIAALLGVVLLGSLWTVARLSAQRPGPSAEPASSMLDSITTDPTLPRAAALTPTQMIVPMGSDGKQFHLFLGDTARAGAPIKQLTSGDDSEFNAVVSPDRRSVLFIRQFRQPRNGQVRAIQVMAADGTGARDLWSRVPSECVTSVVRPAWNPVDQTLLALPCTSSTGISVLLLVHTDGRVERTIDVGNPPDASWRFGDPTFSPDGRQLAFWAGPSGAASALYVTDVANPQAPRRLTGLTGAAHDTFPTWTPDGQSLLFDREVNSTSGAETNLDIYHVPVDGSGQASPLITGPADDQTTSWSPDGKQLAYKTNAPEVGSDLLQVYVSDAAGNHHRPLWEQKADQFQGTASWTTR